MYFNAWPSTLLHWFFTRCGVNPCVSTLKLCRGILPDVSQRRAVDSVAPILQAYGGLELAQRDPARAAVRRRPGLGGRSGRDDGMC